MIRRAPRRNHWTTLPNSTLEDERLSFKAKGLLAYVLSKPDHWRANSKQLSKVGPDGVSSVRTALQELREAGYAELKKFQDSVSGLWSSEWEVGELPIENRTPSTDFPASDKPTLGKPLPLVTTDEAMTDQSSDDEDEIRDEALRRLEEREAAIGPVGAPEAWVAATMESLREAGWKPTPNRGEVKCPDCGRVSYHAIGTGWVYACEHLRESA